jgi:signal transduction histidine kinase
VALRPRLASKSTASYIGLLAASFVVAVAASWMFGRQVDNYTYDYMFQRMPPKAGPPQSVILAIDDATLRDSGGMGHIRGALAAGLRRIAAAKPKVIAVDIILADSVDPREDAQLADAFRVIPNLVLDCEMDPAGTQWEDPLPAFLQSAPALGQVYADPDPGDSVTRAIPLEKVDTHHHRRWALSLEAFRVSRGVARLVESPTDLQVADTIIPIAGTGTGHIRSMRVRYLAADTIPRVSLQRVRELDDPAIASLFAGKAVFVGVTAMTEVRDRLFTPLANGQTPGIMIHASAFETMAQGLFLTDVEFNWLALFSTVLLAAAGLAFRYLPGWWAYLGGGLVMLASAAAPFIFFAHSRVFSFATPTAVAGLATITAAVYYHLVVRRNWQIEQTSRERYQQAMHFVTHEMRTPLSAIQGSSELISRYNLTEEKRHQIALLINSESKRLARMVEIFLNVERLSAGQMELKREAIPVKPMVEVCVDRVRPLGERKHIGIILQPVPEELNVTGDRELMEYACYNLLTNAVKYSPQRTEVTMAAWKDDGHIRIAVKDQGIGMDQKEVKQIFQKFYRTKKAEESGEAGTGIGLSIVQQIVEQHGGRIEVTSQPGAGSCFTLVVPAAAHTPVPAAAERN